MTAPQTTTPGVSARGCERGQGQGQPEHIRDRIAESMVPVAAALAVAVDESDAPMIADLIVDLDRNQMNALAVVLAAHIDPDKPLTRCALPGATKKAARKAAEAFGIDTASVMGDSRKRDVLDARAVTYYAAHLLGDNYSQIGRVMNRDHSTVMHGHSRVGETPRLRAIAARIAESLGWSRETDEVA